ncbi:hypothetical protein [Aquabacterium sp.]|uniref:hypothetical protein n=1 Tax=Aquabacterium sp. TaxID=1872578 RepID=UPI003BB2179E
MSKGFHRQLARIVKCDDRSRAWKKRALKHLEDDCVAEKRVKGGKAVGYELESGRVLCRKKSFKTKEAAEQALEQIELMQFVTDKKPCRAYQCGACGKFHLTSWSSYSDRG